MAARKNKLVLSDNWKDGIKASVLMTKLYSHVTGDNELSQTQINAAKIVLSKLIPDLKAIEHSGSEDGAPIKHTVQYSIVDPKEK